MTDFWFYCPSFCIASSHVPTVDLKDSINLRGFSKGVRKQSPYHPSFPSSRECPYLCFSARLSVRSKRWGIWWGGVASSAADVEFTETSHVVDASELWGDESRSDAWCESDFTLKLQWKNCKCTANRLQYFRNRSHIYLECTIMDNKIRIKLSENQTCLVFANN